LRNNINAAIKMLKASICLQPFVSPRGARFELSAFAAVMPWRRFWKFDVTKKHIMRVLQRTHQDVAPSERLSAPRGLSPNSGLAGKSGVSV
jgi:hypothetical protein